MPPTPTQATPFDQLDEDRIQAWLQYGICDLRAESIRHAVLNLKVTRLPPPPDAEQNTHTRLREFCRVVPVPVSRRDQDGVPGYPLVELCVDGQWKTLREAMDMWFLAKEWKFPPWMSRQCYQHCREQRYGQTFPFWDLPAEVRVAILVHV